MEAHQAHNSKIFLPWHRRFLLDVETMLQEAAGTCDLALPYWNWAVEMGSARHSAVFSADRYGSLNGGENHCVEDGAFGSKTAGSAFTMNDCIKRNGASSIAPYDFHTIMETLRNDSWTGVENFHNVSIAIETILHNAVHGAIGGAHGQMSRMASPYDPLFFLHHGFMDYLWNKWQDININRENKDHMASEFVPRSLQPHMGVQHESTSFPASEMALSMHLVDDDKSTVHTEYACVRYEEEEYGGPCDRQWDRIKGCLDSVTKAKRLLEIPRVINLVDGEDICDPSDPEQFAHSELWLNHLKESGMIGAKEVQDDLEDEKAAANWLAKHMPKEVQPESDCDKMLCFSISELFKVCEGLDAASKGEEDEANTDDEYTGPPDDAYTPPVEGTDTAPETDTYAPAPAEDAYTAPVVADDNAAPAEDSYTAPVVVDDNAAAPAAPEDDTYAPASAEEPETSEITDAYAPAPAEDYTAPEDTHNAPATGDYNVPVMDDYAPAPAIAPPATDAYSAVDPAEDSQTAPEADTYAPAPAEDAYTAPVTDTYAAAPAPAPVEDYIAPATDTDAAVPESAYGAPETDTYAPAPAVGTPVAAPAAPDANVPTSAGGAYSVPVTETYAAPAPAEDAYTASVATHDVPEPDTYAPAPSVAYTVPVTDSYR